MDKACRLRQAEEYGVCSHNVSRQTVKRTCQWQVFRFNPHGYTGGDNPLKSANVSRETLDNPKFI